MFFFHTHRNMCNVMSLLIIEVISTCNVSRICLNVYIYILYDSCLLAITYKQYSDYIAQLISHMIIYITVLISSMVSQLN